MDWAAWRAKVRKFWHTDNPRMASIRDLAVAFGFLALLLGGLWIYSGQPFPKEAPLVVIESGSMMQGPASGFPSPPFGRVGTIDPGDLVIVKRVRSVEAVETAFGSGKRSGYGGHGDVIIYETGGTPIIHRAMLYIEAVPNNCIPNDAVEPCMYRLRETCDAERFATFVQDRPSSEWRQYCDGSTEPITLSLERDGLRLDLVDYPCSSVCDRFSSGFITKGDNNGIPDQPAKHSLQGGPIPLDGIIGKARGELPWFGLVKLSLSGNPRYTSDPTGADQWKILGARAPWDEWVCLFLTLGVLFAAPTAIEFAIRRWRNRKKD